MKAYPTAASGGGRFDALRGRLGHHRARLHFGFLDPSGRGPRPFGSFGLALDRPRTTLQLRRAHVFKAEGPNGTGHSLISGASPTILVRRMPMRLHIEEVIPPHSGLGSGTQLALASAPPSRRCRGCRST